MGNRRRQLGIGVLLVICLLSMSGRSIAGQKQPVSKAGQERTLEATMDWIKNTLENYSCQAKGKKIRRGMNQNGEYHSESFGTSSFDYSWFFIEGCTLSVTITETQTSRFYNSMKGVMAGVQTREPDVTIPRKATIDFSQPQIIKSMMDSETEWTPSVYKLQVGPNDYIHSDFIFTDNALLERVKKAFTHAGKLCGGVKEELF